ncbi:MAG: hypothetical protein QOI66_1180 [Myxococcales bacterium]|nr:hypothetical protein [Myxococcales bacterium]
MELTARACADLTRKYQALLDLRRARDQRGARAAESGPAAAVLRERLRALAQEFPGCLRELDTLGATELARRVEALAQAAGGGAPEPWMAWIAGYHALMRAALHLKGMPPATSDAARARGAAQAAGTPVDAAFIQAVQRPPQGRMGIVVLRTLGAQFGVPPSTIATTLFPRRRPTPYLL